MKKLVMTMIAAAAFAAYAQQADTPTPSEADTPETPETSEEVTPQEPASETPETPEAPASEEVTPQEPETPETPESPESPEEEVTPQEPVSPVDAFCAEWFASTNAAAEWKASHPVRVALIEKYGTASLAQCSFAETANAVVEYAADPGPFDLGDDLDALKKDVLRASLKIMKRALRRKGISFVVAPDGTNPIQTAVDGLSAVLSAKKMEGVKEWVAEWSPGTEWIAPAWMSDEATAELSDSVFFGDTDFDRRAQFRLCAVLGVVQYNAFVDRYNGVEEPPDESVPDAPAEEEVSE